MEILYEDNHLIAVNKRCGELVQGDITGDIPLCTLLSDWLAEKYHKPGKAFVGVVHRLDRPTSGVVLFAKTSKALERMNKLFREDAVSKVYHAIVTSPPTPPAATLRHLLVRNPKLNKSFVVSQGKKAKEAILSYSTIGKSDRYTLLEIELQTGRHHQIRTQLTHIGSPIKGDLKYGAPRSNPDGGISLHARSMMFIHPVKNEPIHIVAPYPTNDRLWNSFR